MKAAVVEKPGDLVVRDINEPTVGDYDALVDILYCAICTGTDQHLIAGEFPWPMKYPMVLGHEAIGRVVETGSKVRYLNPGDLVARVGTTPADDGSYDVAWGGFAERGIATDGRAMMEDGLNVPGPIRRQLVIPGDLDPAAATMIITWRETYSFIKRMGVALGSSVLIVGSGGNGVAFASHARNLGANKISMIGAPAREDEARRAGVTDYHPYTLDDVNDRLKAAASEGFDFAIDAIGRIGQLDICLRHLAKGGTLAQYGIDDLGKCTMDPTLSRGSFHYYKGGYDEAEVHDEVVALVQAGKLDASIWLDLADPVDLADIESEFDDLRARKHLKGIVRIGG